MAKQIPFPDDAGFPPERPSSKQDILLEHLFRVLRSAPAASIVAMQERLSLRGLELKQKEIRHAIAHLRKHAEHYGWTIPHVHGGRPNEEDQKYFAILMDKDGDFHTDPANKTHLREGTASIVTRIATESKNQSLMLKAASGATYLSRPLREELAELADECIGLHKKARRVLRYLKANNA